MAQPTSSKPAQLPTLENVSSYLKAVENRAKVQNAEDFFKALADDIAKFTTQTPINPTKQKRKKQIL